MTTLWLTTYEKSKNQYKHIITKDDYYYIAFRTDKGLNDFIDRSGVDFIKQSENESLQHGKSQSFIAKNISLIEEHFWKIDEIPANAELYKDLSNGSLVDCYYTKENDIYTVYRPNPNAKNVYKPMEIEQHIHYILNNY